MGYIKSFAKKIGMDGAIAFSSGARIVQAVAGALTIFFIATFLSSEEQGFYYTFGSILGIQVFFELGMTTIITQFVAHESAHLNVTSEGITGDQYYISRLASLYRFCVKWYLIISVLLTLALVVVGVFYFRKYGDASIAVDWKLPWIILVIGTALKLFQSPITSILMGIGKVKEMSEMTFYQQIVVPLVMWGGLVLGLKLYVVGISSLASVLVWFLYIIIKGLGKYLKVITKINVSDRVNYLTEIFPLQWKMAISWISGYFIYQLFNPVLFATDGPVVAGKMGMTLQVLSGISALSSAWMSTKIPLYSNLIELKQYHELDNVFNKTLRQMLGVSVVLVTIFLSGLFLLQRTQLCIAGIEIGERLLSFLPTLVLSITTILQSIISSWAIYLRCHMQEPYLITSVVLGILCCLSTFICGNVWGVYGVVVGYFIVVLIVFPWNYKIFRAKKLIWHN